MPKGIVSFPTPDNNGAIAEAAYQYLYRNAIFLVYLTGATLFLSLLLARVFSIVLDLITIQDELNSLKTKVSRHLPSYDADRLTDSVIRSQTARSSTAAMKTADMETRIKELETELRASQAKDRDFGEAIIGVACILIADLMSRMLFSDNLKKQAGQQAQEYDRLAEEHQNAVSSMRALDHFSSTNAPICSQSNAVSNKKVE